jgi:glycosyltransferase involved in cell wall biosynthesis
MLDEYKDYCTIYSQKDGSPQEAINFGMSQASGDIACWLNADDVFEPDTLQCVAAAFRAKPDLQWLYGRCRIIDENGNEIRRLVTFYKNIIGYFYSYNMLLCENYINQPATFWKLDLWRKVQALSIRHKAAWDYELWLNMAKISRPVHLRKQVAKFRRHDTSISNNHFEQQFQEELNIARKYGNFIHYLIHKLNMYKIVTAYKLMK